MRGVNGRSVEESLARDPLARGRLSRMLDRRWVRRAASTLLVGINVVSLAWGVVNDANGLLVWLWLALGANGLLLVCVRRTRRLGSRLLLAFCAVTVLGYVALAGLAEGLRDS